MQQFGSMKVTFDSSLLRKGVVYYSLRVDETDTNIQWLIETRYSALRSLHLRLKKVLQGQLPNFPPKKFLGNTKESFVSYRQKQLINYLNLILTNVYKDKIQILVQFLGENRLEASGKDKGQESEGGKEGIMKQKEEIISRLIDCAYSIQPPDSMEIQFKQKHYCKITLRNIKVPLYVQPLSLPGQSTQITAETFLSQNEAFMQIMDLGMQSMERRF